MDDSAFQLAHVGAGALALVGAVAFAASILGGLSGYGTGLVLPIFLAPVVGVANIVPVMAVGMAFNNASRVVAFRHSIEWPHVRRILVFGLPACAAGAYGYTMSSNYNGRPRLPEVLLEQGEMRLIRRGETLEDLARVAVDEPIGSARPKQLT